MVRWALLGLLLTGGREIFRQQCVFATCWKLYCASSHPKSTPMSSPALDWESRLGFCGAAALGRPNSCGNSAERHTCLPADSLLVFSSSPESGSGPLTVFREKSKQAPCRCWLPTDFSEHVAVYDQKYVWTIYPCSTTPRTCRKSSCTSSNMQIEYAIQLPARAGGIGIDVANLVVSHQKFSFYLHFTHPAFLQLLTEHTLPCSSLKSSTSRQLVQKIERRGDTDTYFSLDFCVVLYQPYRG